MLHFMFKSNLKAEIPIPGKVRLFSPKPSTIWTRITHIMEGNMLYSKSTDLSVNIIKKINLHSNI